MLKSKERTRRASPPNPSPAYMDSKQFGMSLLRNNLHWLNKPKKHC